MVDRVAAMMQARDQLLVDVSHELRSPITRLKVALELLPAGDRGARMQADVAEMEAMVGELLELERLRDGRGRAARPSISARSPATWRGPSTAVPPGVDIEPHGAMVATVDASRVRMVLRNLIENAVKYALPDSAPVRVRLERARRRGDRSRCATTASASPRPTWRRSSCRSSASIDRARARPAATASA